MTPTWTSETVEWQEGGFPDDVGYLWIRTASRAKSGELPTVFGEDSTWYFWDETWADAFGPFETKEQAEAGCKEYLDTL